MRIARRKAGTVGCLIASSSASGHPGAAVSGSRSTARPRGCRCATGAARCRLCTCSSKWCSATPASRWCSATPPPRWLLRLADPVGVGGAGARLGGRVERGRAAGAPPVRGIDIGTGIFTGRPPEPIGGCGTGVAWAIGAPAYGPAGELRGGCRCPGRSIAGRVLGGAGRAVAVAGLPARGRGSARAAAGPLPLASSGVNFPINHLATDASADPPMIKIATMISIHPSASDCPRNTGPTPYASLRTDPNNELSWLRAGSSPRLAPAFGTGS